ncbi:hypothetical protein NicSoilB4_08180 [Arthrobacter sp. NicSoilB4]|uniref:BREX-1 system adenine-specific DNA-methyltransferase PglX n=1 Tax=Arthrobacter sp. NicSoilB4 TaxID=2830997 RepID=UPI001CC7B7E0|nr:BREX-1 system adenine-specific DNA-methyltransferase PglX [Arthrobacter sp. NicSoilB4]BCW66055.1 hypothetical protein NicSoilB4_08180 [Arthrobacter sp. NicSoilB4]
MDLSLLRGFAAGVRVELVGVVGARLAGVLLPGSVERVEFPEAVRRLESVVARSGRDVVVDQVAYTWFNRLVALRFMDVNGYTGVGVVSPAGGAVAGQPEVLADAKAGHIDVEVVGEKVRDRVIGLLSGSVVSGDAQGEAFKLLLAAYCNHWAGPMPFMFERTGDFTELLVPDDLLSDRSIVARILRTLTPEVCSDVEVIGWLYQFYIAARKDEVFAGFKKNKKATAVEIPAATQLFTPHWIVKYLVENSLGRLWLLNNPASDLASRMEYYIAPVEPETDFLKITGPEELKVLDPACGSGHMLTYAFDLLFLMYEEAGYAPSDIPGLILKHNLFGAEIDPRAGALAAFALVMKARAQQKSFLNPGKGTAPNICVLEPVRFTADELEMLVTRGGDKHAEVAFWQAFEDADTFGSLIRPNQELIAPLAAHVESLGEAETLFAGEVLDRARTVLRQSEYLSTRYHVVVANPPYMGSGNMGSKLAEFAKREYPDSKADLFAMFIERCLNTCLRFGAVSMITMQGWLFLTTYTNLRSRVSANSGVHSLAHFGTRAFDSIGGEVVATAAFTLVRGATADRVGSFIRLTGGSNETHKSEMLLNVCRGIDKEFLYRTSFSALAKIPGSPVAYWVSPQVAEAFNGSEMIGARAKKGLSCSGTDAYYRYFWEVSKAKLASHSGSKWFSITKGGAYRKWYGNNEFVINWENNGNELRSRRDVSGKPLAAIRNEGEYFRAGLSWNDVSSNKLAVRVVPSGAIPTDSGPMIYDDLQSLRIAGILNSAVAERFTDILCTSLHYGVGQIAAFPLKNAGTPRRDPDLERLVELARQDWDESENSPGFEGSVLLAAGHFKSISESVSAVTESWQRRVEEVSDLETRNNAAVLEAYGLSSTINAEIEPADVTLTCNPAYRFGGGVDQSDGYRLLGRDAINSFVSYAVGCMFGRFSLDAPGLVLADHGDSLAEYLARVPSPSFMPDEDNVLPVLSDGWFDDDIVERFREFLKASFGEEHFEENLRSVEDALGKDIRKYFVQDFYKDHVQRYKKRPIYWMFSSPKGSFNALIYMHRYRPDTVSVVLNDYLHEFQAKLRARRSNLDQTGVSTLSTAKEQTAARKESEQIGKMLLELEAWEQSVLYPLATEQIDIDLDDGVKANYSKFGTALHNKFTGF